MIASIIQDSEEFVILSYHHPEIFEDSKIFIGYGEAQPADFDHGPFPCFTANDWKGNRVSAWHFEHWVELDLQKLIGNREKEKCPMPSALRLEKKLWNYASETPESYAQKVAQVQTAMVDGEVYVMNLCLELAGTQTIGKELLLAAYEKFLTKNPIHCGGIFFTREQNFCSFSPEVFLHQQGEKFSTYPIKGTGTKEFLKSSKKEASELEMVTDLLRNDLGQIAEKVWIQRERFFTQLPHFAHAQSQICAQVQDFSWSKFQSLLPCGSMTGAPKSRVLQLTKQLENFERGLYAGNFGLRLSPEQGIWNILIRTLFLKKVKKLKSSKDDKKAVAQESGRAGEQDAIQLCSSAPSQLSWSFPVGAGITVESNPESEAQECIAKAKILQELFEG